MTIMIVDDEPDIRESIKDVLNTAGYEVVAMSNGQEAFEYLKTRKVRMMLVDFSMPGMSGEELLLSLETVNKRPPALIITALAPWRMLKLLKYGIGYIRKPVNTKLLIGTIETMIKKEAANECAQPC